MRKWYSIATSKMSSESNRILSAMDYNPANLVFHAPKDEKPAGFTTPTGVRVRIGYRFPDNKVGDVLLATDSLYSFGIKDLSQLSGNQMENKRPTYAMKIAMFDRDGATAYQQRFVEVFEDIALRCKQYIVENRVALRAKSVVSLDSLSEFTSSSFFWPVNDNDVRSDRGPTLTAKLFLPMEGKDPTRMHTRMRDGLGQPVELNTLLESRGFHVTASIQIESMWIGASAKSLQVRLMEAQIVIPRKEDTFLLSQFRQVHPEIYGPSPTGADMDMKDEIKEDLHVANGIPNFTPSMPSSGEARHIECGSIENSESEDADSEQEVAVSQLETVPPTPMDISPSGRRGQKRK